MREFSWNVFTMTGDIETYLLYKEMTLEEAENSVPVEETNVALEELSQT